jgi:hypothetical protein
VAEEAEEAADEAAEQEAEVARPAPHASEWHGRGLPILFFVRPRILASLARACKSCKPCARLVGSV